MHVYTWKCITGGAPYQHNDVNKLKGTRIGWKMKKEIYHTVNCLQSFPVTQSFGHLIIQLFGHSVTRSCGH